MASLGSCWTLKLQSEAGLELPLSSRTAGSPWRGARDTLLPGAAAFPELLPSWGSQNWQPRQQPHPAGDAGQARASTWPGLCLLSSQPSKWRGRVAAGWSYSYWGRESAASANRVQQTPVDLLCAATPCPLCPRPRVVLLCFLSAYYVPATTDVGKAIPSFTR